MMRPSMIKPATLSLLLICCTACMSFGQEEPSSTVKVDVRLVNVFVTVTDSHGAPISHLTKDNFQVGEDGSEQKISGFDKESALPLSIIMAIDTICCS